MWSLKSYLYISLDYYYYFSIKMYLALGYDTHPIKSGFNYIHVFAILIASFDILHHFFYAILRLSIPEIKSLIWVKIIKKNMKIFIILVRNFPELIISKS